MGEEKRVRPSPDAILTRLVINLSSGLTGIDSASLSRHENGDGSSRCAKRRVERRKRSGIAGQLDRPFPAPPTSLSRPVPLAEPVLRTRSRRVVPEAAERERGERRDPRRVPLCRLLRLPLRAMRFLGHCETPAAREERLAGKKKFPSIEAPEESRGAAQFFFFIRRALLFTRDAAGEEDGHGFSFPRFVLFKR